MEKIIEELKQNINVRTNLSTLRKEIKDAGQLEQAQKLLSEDIALIEGFLQSEDAKTRKNAALLIGELGWQESTGTLFAAYEAEETRFVKSAYLESLFELEASAMVPKFKEHLKELQNTEITEENRKHIEEESRQLQRNIIKYEGVQKHKFSPEGKELEILLLTNRNLRENIAKMIPEGKTSVHPLGVLVKTDKFTVISKIRTYRELVFPVHAGGLLPADPKQAAETIWAGDLYKLLSSIHTESGSFFYRLEVKSPMDLEKRSDFARRFTGMLDSISAGKMVNSTTDYEVEIRLISNKEGKFFPCIRLYTYKDTRFAYRKQTIPASMAPSTAALICELAKPYLKENAQIMDPFCGVGTLLIERNRLVPAHDMYATDTFGDAILKGRENAAAAKTLINFIHRDFFNFKHEYPFDEIITDMPMRGTRTKEDMDYIYSRFFRRLSEVLVPSGIVILYTNESSLVKKQLRLHNEIRLLQETNMQKATPAKPGFDLFILRI